VGPGTGQWQSGDPDITIVMAAGYDVTRLAWVLGDLPVELIGRIRGDRVMRLPKPPRVYDPKHHAPDVPVWRGRQDELQLGLVLPASAPTWGDGVADVSRRSFRAAKR
jgi:hypothetical protein